MIRTTKIYYDTMQEQAQELRKLNADSIICVVPGKKGFTRKEYCSDVTYKKGDA